MRSTGTLQFVGTGGAFAPISRGHSSMVIESEGRRILFDCGGSVQFKLKEVCDLTPADIDAVWISHLHADHIGSLEWFAFHRYFQPKLNCDGKVIKPKLVMNGKMMEELWETSLKGGMERMNGKIATLTDYFDCYTFDSNPVLRIGGLFLLPVKTLHMDSGYKRMDSYGVFIESTNGNTYITSDTKLVQNSEYEYYRRAHTIFHDCETISTKSGVHPHYENLNMLVRGIKNKMWLYHYANKIDSVEKDGFAGFVETGQKFDL
jgi:ribonuclease BN (tRNA processing enzyme)